MAARCDRVVAVSALVASGDGRVLIGHWTDPIGATGCTVVLCPRGAIGAVAIRGGAPCTRETEIFKLTKGVDPRHVHGVLLTGGSVFGLSACDGVVRWLGERGAGFRTAHACIPIVGAAGLYDLGVGDPHAHPDAAAGYAACEVARADAPAEGSVGAGTGATVGKAGGMARCTKAGVGMAEAVLPSGARIAALIAVNAFGEVVDPAAGAIVAGVRAARGKGFQPVGELLAAGARVPFGNTAIGVLVTDVALAREDATEVAEQAHDGFAQTIRPTHTRVDGDTLFVLSTGSGRRALRTALDRIALQHAATSAVAAAVLRAVRAATPVAGIAPA